MSSKGGGAAGKGKAKGGAAAPAASAAAPAASAAAPAGAAAAASTPAAGGVVEVVIGKKVYVPPAWFVNLEKKPRACTFTGCRGDHGPMDRCRAKVLHLAKYTCRRDKCCTPRVKGAMFCVNHGRAVIAGAAAKSGRAC
jgi:hypothetical protein